ncbi:MAG: cofactor assembly of complex C subunit B [Chroococcales cyanobacterium]
MSTLINSLSFRINSVNTPILSSTLLLTLLLMVGLVFFIRASIKDRTQQLQLIAQSEEISLFQQLQEYFQKRAYQITEVNPEAHQVTMKGFVTPSWFLAIFLTVLAGCGWLCLALVLSYLYPSLSQGFLGLIALAPIAGIFYWKKAARWETLSFQVDSLPNAATTGESVVTITAHRDELIQLRQALPLQLKED